MGAANGSNGHARAPLRHNRDAEASVLGGIFLRNELLDALPDLEVEDFYESRHRVVFSAMRNLRAADKPIDVVTVELEIDRVDQIQDTHKLEMIGGPAFLGQLILHVPTVDNVLEYAAAIRRLRHHRNAEHVLSSALERVRSWPHDPAEMISEVAGELQRIEVDASVAARSSHARWCLPLPELLGHDEPDEDDAADWIIRDIIPRGEPGLIGGPMKGGKTWTALDLCIAVALGEDWLGRFTNTLGAPARVLGVFLEDNTRRLRKRLWELTRTRGTSPNNALLVENLRISRAPLRLPDATDQRRLAAEVKAWGPVLIVIDNLTRVMVGDPNSTREASAFTKAWAELGNDTGASIVFLHHTKKPMGDPAATDPFDQLRGSGDFGATARNIIVTTPIRRADSTGPAKLSEVRMRGNLDLRRESFTLGFERQEIAGRWQAVLTDRGEIEKVRDEVKLEKKQATEAKKRQEFVAEQQRRRNLAITIATKEGAVSSRRLAEELSLSSDRSVAGVLLQLEADKVLVRAGKRGFELAATDRQEGMSL